jgi:hypothetical protein
MRTVALAGLVLALGASAARAEENETESSETKVDLDIAAALKSSLLLSRAPDDPMLFPERDAAASLWRFRVSPTLKLGEDLTIDAAYEHRLRAAAQDSAVGLAVLPAEVPAPYRIRQLDWQLASGSAYVWHHEIDRLAVNGKLGRLDLTAGRQAVGWGRGVLFSAVDLFAPFSALEADREWRRGVDAVRAEVTLTDTVSSDVVVAFGPSVDDSVFAGRVRGYHGEMDLELIGGWRARDLMAGATSSAAIGGGEVHAELAAFRAPDPLPAGGQLGDRTAIKGVLGGSYQFSVGNGLPVFVEYHYSGFGAPRASDLVMLLAQPAFRARFERGDSQILGRHAITVATTYEFSPELSTGLRWIQSPRDGSGVIVPTATATLGDHLAVQGAFYLPWGKAPLDLTLRSEYGSAPITGFLQLLATY